MTYGTHPCPRIIGPNDEPCGKPAPCRSKSCYHIGPCDDCRQAERQHSANWWEQHGGPLDINQALED